MIGALIILLWLLCGYLSIRAAILEFPEHTLDGGDYALMLVALAFGPIGLFIVWVEAGPGVMRKTFFLRPKKEKAPSSLADRFWKKVFLIKTDKPEEDETISRSDLPYCTNSYEPEPDKRGCGWMGCGHSKCEEVCSGEKREPVAWEWIEMVPVNDPRSWTDDPEEISEWYSRNWFKRIFGRV